MFNIGDIVVYTTYGICKITEKMSRMFNGTNNEYYVLVPLNESKTQLTIPVNNPLTIARLHQLLSTNEINNIINQISYLETYWIDNENERKKEFAETLKNGDRLETLKMIKSIKNHQLSIKDKNRKLHACDEQVMRDAEKLIVDEFSYVLNIDRLELLGKIQDEIIKSLEV